mgnify:CR=1 FL=1
MEMESRQKKFPSLDEDQFSGEALRISQEKVQASGEAQTCKSNVKELSDNAAKLTAEKALSVSEESQ